MKFIISLLIICDNEWRYAGFMTAGSRALLSRPKMLAEFLMYVFAIKNSFKAMNSTVMCKTVYRSAVQLTVGSSPRVTTLK